MIDSEEIVTGEIASIAFGGEGILRHQGLVIFVPFTAPGDQVTAKIIKRQKNFATGQLVSIDKHSSQRTAARCPYFGTCGGCQLQHLTYAAQLEQKQRFIRDALQRIGGADLATPIEITGSAHPWAYRRHVRLQLQPTDVGMVAGYATHPQIPPALLQVSECPIFVDDQDPILAQVQEVASLLLDATCSGWITIIKNGQEGYVLLFQFDGEQPAKTELVVKEAIERWEQWHGVIVIDARAKVVLGNIQCSFRVDEMEIRFSPEAFVQNNPEQSQNLYHKICDVAVERGVSRVVDLYCGIGVTSLMLARRGCQVAGIEGNPLAIELAKDNAHRNGVTQTRFITGAVESLLDRTMKQETPDLVLVNPPRTGLAPKVRDLLIKSRPKQIAYISCMPSTLARDLKEFFAAGYKVTYCHAYDMFPQTTHVETLVWLSDRI